MIEVIGIIPYRELRKSMGLSKRKFKKLLARTYAKPVTIRGEKYFTEAEMGFFRD